MNASPDRITIGYDDTVLVRLTGASAIGASLVLGAAIVALGAFFLVDIVE
jgi:hypothetical protein